MVKPTTKDVARHPIGVVTERTGLSAHVLRAWERRHGVVRPARADGGRRLYSDADVERIALLHCATRPGRSIAAMASLSTGKLRQLVAEDAERAMARPTLARSYRDQAMDAVRALEPERLNLLLGRALLSLGTMIFLEDVVAPLLVEIGDEWHHGRITIAHEHAASGTMTQCLGWLSRSLEVPGDAPRTVIATPRGEHHVFGALMAAAAASHDGWHVTWLGSDLPVAHVAAGAEQGRARAVALSTSGCTNHLKRELRTLRTLLPPHVPVMVGGAGAARLGDVGGITTVRDLTHWRALLHAHAAPAE